MKPKFLHDCEYCTFLGHKNGADLYFCDQGGVGPTVIARHSDDGSDYTSGLAMADHYPDLREAKRLADSMGLLS